MPLYFFYTVQREVTLNVYLVTFWRENADGHLCSPMASVTLITGLGWSNRAVQLFFLWSTIENCWSTKVWSRRLHCWRREVPKGGGWGRGSPLPQVGVRGSRPGIFWKIASKWCILVYFRAVIAKFKTENLYEKICVSLHKDVILDKINY